MCGIVGLLYKRPHSRELVLEHLRLGVQALSHRGPDGSGLWSDGPGATYFGHARLKIIDTSERASQPMLSSDGRFSAVFNGEIYNYRELRRELEDKGVYFRSESDTEVLIESIRAWGDDALNRFQGMFALAVYDKESGSVLLARDPMGKKPLVYAECEDGIAFASEIPALARLRSMSFAYDLDAIASMLVGHLRHIPDPWTAFRGVKRLLAGHAMMIREGVVQRTWRYWNPLVSFKERTSSTRVREILERAVDIRLRADVPLAVLLSGGVDSTSVAGIASQKLQCSLTTFAYGTGPEDPDIQRARLASISLGSSHTEIFCKGGPSWDLYVALLQQYGDPIALLPLLHAAELCEEIRARGIKVVLSGNGADEIFYGYEGCYRLGLLARVESMVPKFAFQLRGDPYASLVSEPGDRKAALYSAWAQDAWSKVLTDGSSAWLRNRASEMCRYWGEALRSEKYIDESSFVGLMVENTHSITTISDLSAMMFGVEMRSPFLDRELVQCALLTHFSRKVGIRKRADNLKMVLREAVSDLVPRELLSASKRGFGMSIQERDLFRGEWKVHAARYLEDSDTIGGLFDQVKIRGEWERYLKGDNSSVSLIARVLALQVWVREVVPRLKHWGMPDESFNVLRAGVATIP